MKALSEKRIKLLQLIGHYQRAGQFPLVREVAADLGLAGESSLRSLLKPLVQDGYLTKHGGGQERRQCVYRLTAKAQHLVPELLVPEASNRLLLPKVGLITAGLLQEALQDCAEFVDLGDSLRVQPGDFLLEVSGDSMIGDGILPGDLVQLRPGIQPHSGAIAAVQIKHGNGVYEATLKHIHFQPGRKTVRLRASNPAYAEMTVLGKDVEIAGVYQGLIRPRV